MKKMILATGLGAMLLAGGIAIAQTGGDAGHPGMHRGGGMHGADTNNDGTVTRAELTASLDQRFARLDTNGDGQITQAERDAQHKARADARFKALDADGNGQVSRAEYDAAHEKRQAQRAERGEKTGERGEGRRWHRGGRGTGGMMDANKDGTVTKAEFQSRALAMFDRADANKDSQVTQQERDAARAAFKAKRGEPK
ncbi:EF-hand domain-containing protein [Sphingomonas cavernae]|uniref:Calcium-binding protein n=1 Tax=Sphingomonas cavernae TaxID=2320861 RepID=A0A418W854_9SPHN|nr:calcium-binding protein [Sphingomonas cavernae]RJF86176.1 calcium-binding protein [Sphingomonas cavernae]